MGLLETLVRERDELREERRKWEAGEEQRLVAAVDERLPEGLSVRIGLSQTPSMTIRHRDGSLLRTGTFPSEDLHQLARELGIEEG